MSFAILGIDHVVLRARDPERLIRFYCEVLGTTVAKRNERIKLVHLAAGRSQIDVVPETEPRQGKNVDHVCLRIDPFDGPALVAHLKSHGIDPGEIVTRFGAEGDGPSLYLHDPEGNQVELKGPPQR
jgi:catechol 2,3-dioxygenase-like lactoylglutathione lyase family enzyme